MSEEITKKEYRKEKIQDETLEDMRAVERARIDAQQQSDAEEQAQKKPKKGKIFFYHAEEDD